MPSLPSVAGVTTAVATVMHHAKARIYRLLELGQQVKCPSRVYGETIDISEQQQQQQPLDHQAAVDDAVQNPSSAAEASERG